MAVQYDVVGTPNDSFLQAWKAKKKKKTPYNLCMFPRIICVLPCPCQACHFHLLNETNSNAVRFQILTDRSLTFATSDEGITQLE